MSWWSNITLLKHKSFYFFSRASCTWYNYSYREASRCCLCQLKTLPGFYSWKLIFIWRTAIYVDFCTVCLLHSFRVFMNTFADSVTFPSKHVTVREITSCILVNWFFCSRHDRNNFSLHASLWLNVGDLQDQNLLLWCSCLYPSETNQCSCPAKPVKLPQATLLNLQVVDSYWVKESQRGFLYHSIFVVRDPS